MKWSELVSYIIFQGLQVLSVTHCECNLLMIMLFNCSLFITWWIFFDIRPTSTCYHSYLPQRKSTIVQEWLEQTRKARSTWHCIRWPLDCNTRSETRTSNYSATGTLDSHAKWSVSNRLLLIANTNYSLMGGHIGPNKINKHWRVF